MDTTGRRTRTRSWWRRTPTSPGLVALVALLGIIAATGSARLIDTTGASSLPTSPPPTHPSSQDGRMNTITHAPVVGDEVPGTRPGGELAFLGAVRQVHANGSTVGYRQIGSGPPVVLVVGQGCTMAMWGT